ncbi:hypothetical protein [Paracoccus seriniphilus]|uniref:Di-and tricarboxylate transporter n=1 Tax=Paracoccus seriniphilus TaxID=184748 RepID=A0A239Q3V9_9RHOB|nr:hypothetical protein [Paracoccus seriniphilus]WCR15613.1 hypothetical protein JHW44_13915 [Paracoccus seriniphilus]SNT76637.1 hypothetical protein SAMN05444959_12332 [Paracoccus seriniphilus]
MAGDDVSLSMTLRRAAIAFVMAVSLLLVFVESRVLTCLAVIALIMFLFLARRQLKAVNRVPLLLSVIVLGVALSRGVLTEALWQAMDRMLFLSALIAMLGTLRSAAAIAPEVLQAGAYVTNQPASRRYLAMTMGGHLFGVLINFGGLALLLDLVKRSMATPATANLPEAAREARLRRMTLAVVRGFSMISLWSPFGFATNAILITLPGVSYMDFGPVGFAMSFLFIAIGWGFDRIDGRRFRRLGLPRPSPPQGSWRGAALMVAHVLALGAGIVTIHELTSLSFQQALILMVPTYALLWAASAGRRAMGGAATGVVAASRMTWLRLSDLGAEVGVFAAAGFLPVILLAIIPIEDFRATIIAMGLGPVALALGLSLLTVALAFCGVNPIVTASVFGAIAAQLAVPGLSNAAIALAITGGWTAVIGLSPLITTLVIAGTIMERSTSRIGLVWNGPYCLAILFVWLLFLTTLIWSGAV